MTPLKAESKEELKSLLMRVKEESEKNWLKTQHSKNKDYSIWSHAAAATAAKSLHLCPTLCNPIDGSPPGSSVHGIL